MSNFISEFLNALHHWNIWGKKLIIILESVEGVLLLLCIFNLLVAVLVTLILSQNAYMLIVLNCMAHIAVQVSDFVSLPMSHTIFEDNISPKFLFLTLDMV